MKEITPETTIGDIVADDYRTADVFEKYGIDFCCGGKVSLAEVCLERGLEIDVLVNEVKALRQEVGGRGQNYSAWALSFLADYIVNAHHKYLKENNEKTASYTRKIAGIHGSRHPEVVEISAIFDRIAQDLVGHLKEEEEILFPAIKRVEAARIGGSTPEANDRETIRTSLTKLQREHEEVGEAVHTVRYLSNEYTIPADACNAFIITYQKLKEFEDDLHKHVHLENNILFLKAAQL